MDNYTMYSDAEYEQNQKLVYKTAQELHVKQVVYDHLRINLLKDAVRRAFIKVPEVCSMTIRWTKDGTGYVFDFDSPEGLSIFISGQDNISQDEEFNLGKNVGVANLDYDCPTTEEMVAAFNKLRIGGTLETLQDAMMDGGWDHISLRDAQVVLEANVGDHPDQEDHFDITLTRAEAFDQGLRLTTYVEY